MMRDGVWYPVPYYDDKGRTWIGRGPLPFWIRDAKGKTKDDFVWYRHGLWKPKERK